MQISSVLDSLRSTDVVFVLVFESFDFGIFGQLGIENWGDLMQVG